MKVHLKIHQAEHRSFVLLYVCKLFFNKKMCYLYKEKQRVNTNVLYKQTKNPEKKFVNKITLKNTKRVI